MLLFPIGFFYACFMVASKRIAAVAAQGKCSFPWDGIGLAHKRQLRFHRAVCKTAISPERCIIAPYFIGGLERSAFRERHAPSLQAPERLQVDGMKFSAAPWNHYDSSRHSDSGTSKWRSRYPWYLYG